MTTKHTPGPWFVNHESFDCPSDKLSIEAADDYFIAQVDGGISQKANARLIAAAPDLLAALQHSIALADRNRDALELLGQKVERPPEMQAVYDQCVAAVAKAAGAA